MGMSELVKGEKLYGTHLEGSREAKEAGDLVDPPHY